MSSQSIRSGQSSTRGGFNPGDKPISVQPNPPNLNVTGQVIQEMSDLRNQVIQNTSNYQQLQQRSGRLEQRTSNLRNQVNQIQNTVEDNTEGLEIVQNKAEENKNKIEEFKDYLDRFMNQVKSALKSVGSLKEPFGKIYTELGKGVGAGRDIATAAYGSAKDNPLNVFLVVLVIVIVMFLLYFFMKEKSIEQNTEKIEENQDRIDELERKEPEIVYVPQPVVEQQRDNKATYIILASFLALLYFVR